MESQHFKSAQWAVSKKQNSLQLQCQLKKKKNKKHPWTYLNQHGKQIDVEHERELA